MVSSRTPLMRMTRRAIRRSMCVTSIEAPYSCRTSGKLVLNAKAVGVAQRSGGNAGCPSAAGLYPDSPDSLVAAPRVDQVAVRPLRGNRTVRVYCARNPAIPIRVMVHRRRCADRTRYFDYPGQVHRQSIHGDPGVPDPQPEHGAVVSFSAG